MIDITARLISQDRAHRLTTQKTGGQQKQLERSVASGPGPALSSDQQSTATTKPALPIQNDQLKKLLSDSRRTLFIAGRPIDGDSLASAVALKLASDQLGVISDVACADPVPADLEFLLRGLTLKREPDLLLYDLIVVLDCGDLNLTGFGPGLTKIIKSPELGTVVNIDHHIQTKPYGNFAKIDQQAASAGVIVYDLLKNCSFNITEPIATALLTTLYHDTGSFQHSNTSVVALRMAAECVRCGADAADIAARLYRNKPIKVFRLWGRALKRLEYFPKTRMVSSVITLQDLKELGVTAEEAKGIVSIISQVPESRLALLLTEEESGVIKGSLRSDEGKDTDVARIAKLLGGGGHRLASGFKIKGRIEKKHDGRYHIV